MIHGTIYNHQNQQLILPNVMKTTSAIERMRGLLYRKPLNENEALLIQPCSSIHTIGMKYDIDAIFLTRDLQVKKIFSHLKPWRFAMSFGAAMVLEVIAGNADKIGLGENMILQWETN